MKLLSDIKIVAFTQFLLGPVATQYLADLGADVIKVENPVGGAFERSWAGGKTFLNGESALFMLANRNARSVTLDLKHPDGLAAALRLVSDADVLIQNFRPGTLDRLGLGWEAVSQLNPKIIYASASGYGSKGPDRHLPGQDLLLQAVSGLAAITGRHGDPPTPAGAPVIDQHGAALLAMGILAGLHHRDRTGEGQEIEITMLQAAFDLQMEPLIYALNGGTMVRPRNALGSAFHEAPYGIYPTADGHIALSMNPMQRISEAFGHPAALEPFLNESAAFTERERAYEEVASLLAPHPTAAIVEKLRSAGVWCAPVLDYQSIVADPVCEHLDPLVAVEHPVAGTVTLLKHPVQYSSESFEVDRVPPVLGQHTDEVLAEVGYTAEEIGALRSAGVV